MAPTVKRLLVVFGLIAAAFLSVAVSVAQQPKGLPPAEPANIIRLRQQWFYQQRAYPNKYIPRGARLKALQQLRKMEAAQKATSRQLKEQSTTLTGPSNSAAMPAISLSSTSWTLIGPQPTTTQFAYNPVSGRVSALAVDPVNSDIVYMGGAQGGVWKTTDGGTTWTPLTDNQPSLAVGSIAVDPSTCDATGCQTIYAGTGEENFSVDSYYGAGILKSTDGGSTWTQHPGAFVGPFGSDWHEGGAYIGSLAVQPGNSQMLLAGVRICVPTSSGTRDCYSESGLFTSTDAGQNWSLVLYGTPATKVIFDPTNANIVYASFYGAGVYKGVQDPNSGIWTWGADNGTGANALKTTGSGRTALAIDPRSPTTLYAGVSDSNGSLMGLFKTTDGGVNWMQLPSSAFPDPAGYCSTTGGNPQCFYDNEVAVDPATSAVIVGGSAEGSPPGTAPIWVSTDGGSTWSDIDPVPATNDVQAIHPDVHAFAFAADGSKMYVGSDGGVWSTTDITTSPVTWTNLNASLALTQFYPGMSMAPYDAAYAFGGTQDNGPQKYTGSEEWDSVGPCGDAGWMAVATSNPAIVFQTCTFFAVVLESVASGAPGTWFQLSVPTDSTDSSRQIMNPPLVVDASNNAFTYFGTYRAFQSSDGGSSWADISSGYSLTSTSSGVLTTIAVAPSDSNYVYTGSSDGRIEQTATATTGAAGGWFDISTGNGLPNRWVTAVAVDPTNALTVYATFSGFSGFTDSLGHVFVRPASSTSWTDISGNLPNIPVNDIVVDPDVPNTLYVGTDLGVFMTSDGGGTWTPLNSGLPDVAVVSLRLNEASRVLRAATHGRSAWDLYVPASLPVATFSTATVDFGQQAINTTSASQTVTMTNSGAASMTISGISVAGPNSADFAETNGCPATLDVGGSCTITLTFTPTVAGAESADLQVADSAPASPQLVALSGSGVVPPAPAVTLSPLSVTFGDQVVDQTSASQDVMLTNTGNATLTIASIALTGTNSSDFGENNNCGSSVTASSACTITVTFTPSATGLRSASISITDDAADSPQTVSLSGTGTTSGGGSPAVTLSATSLDFGSQTINSTSAAKVVTLTNSGTAALTISSTATSVSSFAQTDNCPVSPATLSVGANCSISVTFTPSSTGTITGALTITDDASDSPQTVALTGTGTASSSANPVPLINQPLVPDAVAPGSSGFTLTLNGTGFVSGATVDWNGTPLTTTFVSGSQLTAAVPGTDTAAEGTASIVAVNPAPGGGSSNVTFFSVTSPSSSVSFGKSDLGTINEANAVAAGDFNGDGKLDLVVPGVSDNAVAVLIGNGDGTFLAQANYPVGGQPVSVTMGDFNGDGNLDLAISNESSDTISILLGKGDGTFQASVEYSTGTTPEGITAADFNGDGKLDLAVASDGSNAVSILLGNGDGSFQTHVEYTAGAVPFSLTTGDFNGDGRLDLAVADVGTSEVSVLAGNGDGSFQAPTSYPVGTSPRAVITGDFNGDGQLDLAAANENCSTLPCGAGSVSILLGNGDGTFQSPANYSTGSSPESLAISDFNADGRLDLATANFADNTISFLMGNGDGTFQPQVDSSAGSGSTAVAAGDFNGDGKPDLASANYNSNNVSVFLQATVTTGPAITVSPVNLSFTDQPVGQQSAAQPVQVTNSGTLSVNFTGITITSNFGETDNCGSSLAPGANCTIDVTFTPTTTGTLTGTLSIADDASDSPQTVALSGTGVSPAVTFSLSSLSFPSQGVGTTSAAQSVTVTNSGSGDLTFPTGAVTVSGTNAADFALASDTCSGQTVAPNGTCAVGITFTPSVAGSESATLNFADNASGSPQTVALSGTGVAPSVTLSPPSLSFPSQTVGTTSAAESVTVTSSGNANLTFGAGAVTVAGSNAADFSVASDTCSGQSIAPNGTCVVAVAFKPSLAGSEAATLSFADNASGSPQTVPLSGTGEDFGLAVASGTPSSATVTAGSSASYSLSVSPEGGFNQAVSLGCTGAPSKATCTVSPASVTPDGTNPAPVSVKVTTTAASLAPPGPRGGPPPVGFSMHEWWIALLLLLMLGTLALAFNPRRRRLPLLAGTVLLAAIAMSCGGGGGGGGGNTTTTPGTPKGTYTLTVTGTSGSLQHSTTVTLVVN